ncbi:hypothetical protein [Alterisphingorhabdus coralli]|uniref:Uncharacterized protein n=1 Tax=Alterisphingorhabdus coralli TaxID=3071408 RepID=A0AA97I3A5_9SPHN|nr:hypothetical protein [Parasphingorhabdus sp. SCSIO 66989]WOE76580.1 hypothetical protein RB602_07670 [Parasphingorhabdus sp. SCSIO 66989]
MDAKRIELFRKTNQEGTLIVDATLKEDGAIEIFFHDIGKTAENTWGNRDYERSLTIPKDKLGLFALALIGETFADDARALSKVENLCKAHDIPTSGFSF